MAGAEEWREVGIWVTSSQGAPCRRPPLPSSPSTRARTHTHTRARGAVGKQGRFSNEGRWRGSRGAFLRAKRPPYLENIRNRRSTFPSPPPPKPSIFTRFNVFHPPPFVISKRGPNIAWQRFELVEIEGNLGSLGGKKGRGGERIVCTISCVYSIWIRVVGKLKLGFCVKSFRSIFVFENWWKF